MKKRIKAKFSQLLIASTITGMGLASSAVITFDIQSLQQGDNIPAGYGDRITSATAGNFSYGLDRGITPNVVVNYGSGTPRYWNTGYGNLTDVCSVVSIVVMAT